MRGRLITAGVLLALCAAPAAHASTAETEGQIVHYAAGTGEANDLSASAEFIGDTIGIVRVTDAGAAITPGLGCVADVDGTVICITPGRGRLEVALGDGDDTADATGLGMSFVASGGDGNDAITGAAGESTLSGDGGNDSLRAGSVQSSLAGGDGADTLNGGSYGDQLDGGAGVDSLSGAGAGDNLIGGSGADELNGDGGADVLRGGTGTDAMHGGSGPDQASYDERSSPVEIVLDGQANDGAPGENDLIASDVEQAAGGSGPDVLTDAQAISAELDGLLTFHLSGRGGDDILVGDATGSGLSGGDGNDTLSAGSGAAVLDGGPGDDLVEGGSGDDQLIGNGGSDVITGGPGHNLYSDGDGDDDLTGGPGQDEFFDGPGADVASGEEGNDDFHQSDDSASDFLRGGAGTDEIDFPNWQRSVAVMLTHGFADLDGLDGVEDVTGTGWDDQLEGDDAPNRIDGGGGNDALDGGAGADTLRGRSEAGSDEGSDSLVCGSDLDVALASPTDTVDADCEERR